MLTLMLTNLTHTFHTETTTKKRKKEKQNRKCGLRRFKKEVNLIFEDTEYRKSKHLISI